MIRGENTKYPATTFVNNLRYGWRWKDIEILKLAT